MINRLSISRKQSKQKSSCEQLGLALIFIFLGFPLLVAGWLLLTLPDRYQTEVNFRSKALLAHGVVTKIKRSTDCYGTGGLGYSCTSRCEATIQFVSHKGRVAKFWDNCTWLSLRKSQTVPVLYDPTVLGRHLIKARVDRGDSPESRAKADLITSLLLALFGIGQLTYAFFIYKSEQKRT